ncbi:nitroreductase family protein [Desulfovibrio sp. UCD-KL4C]|uniref:nitroreductase family protein n=1 Tax=Desulfovibrio sp. UCD-KL4C TaxID=2578120 RepID=UPI0025BE04F8|nr:nitroreductase family protein [Desulfovibrio sp. UCD-KL4C]
MTISVKDAIKQRHSVRSYLDTPLNDSDIMEILDAGRNAPSSLNSQPWRFKVVTDKTTIEWLSTKKVSRNQSWIGKAPAVIVCCVDLDGYIKDSQASAFFFRENNIMEEEPMQGIEEYVAKAESEPDSDKFGASVMNLSIAMSFMMLRATELGLGSCWVGMFNPDLIKEHLNMSDKLRIAALLVIGKPDESGTIPRNRKTIDDILIK